MREGRRRGRKEGGKVMTDKTKKEIGSRKRTVKLIQVK